MTLMRTLLLTFMPSGAVPAKTAWGWTWPQVGQLCLFVLTVFCAAGIAHAQIPGAPQNVRASIEAETSSPAPGDTVTIAIVMDPKPGWHDYWLNPGDAGTPLELDWKLPPGVTSGPIRAPVPETLIVSGFMNHIYKQKHAFLVDVKIPPQVQPRQQIDVEVEARWSACSDTVCVPEGATLSVPLTIGDGEIGASARSRFDIWRAALPVPLDAKGRYQVVDGKVTLAIPYPDSAAVGPVHFFSLNRGFLDYAAPQEIWRDRNEIIIRTASQCSADEREFSFSPVVCDNFSIIPGLLRIGEGQGLLVKLEGGNVVPSGAALPALSSTGKQAPENLQSTINFGWILGISVLGGLLLNLMPCVFPILGLKALSLAKLGGDESEARRDALAYSAGVILSCLALGGLLLALRAGGEEIGWAFQLQEPAFVLLLLLLMVAVTANLAGLFDIGSIDAGDRLTRQGGVAGSFWTGVLAAVVATPCTGPFMAAALGAALLLPVAQALVLFAGLGFGLALPFLALAYVPALRRMLPKPGPWLDTFRKAMAVPMGLTALALVWLFWRLMGGGGLLLALLAMGAMLIGLLIMVRVKGRAEVARSKSWAALASVIFAMGLIAIGRLPQGSEANAPGQLASKSFTAQRLAALRADGKPVFLYFTADWCVTCKVNEATAIDREDTAQAFREAGIITLVGDFTRRDPAIARFLAQHGRSGVPLYLYYPRGREPQILPQILTVDTLTALAK
jgi:DsbC/DsbD-like thiol-disulfide interchange protein/cytochrome c biogenesis protein CcdA